MIYVSYTNDVRNSSDNEWAILWYSSRIWGIWLKFSRFALEHHVPEEDDMSRRRHAVQSHNAKSFSIINSNRSGPCVDATWMHRPSELVRETRRISFATKILNPTSWYLDCDDHVDIARSRDFEDFTSSGNFTSKNIANEIVLSWIPRRVNIRR